jgi:hypothetical protein
MPIFLVRSRVVDILGALIMHPFRLDHDVFRIYYMRHLAKRLLLQQSASDDVEKSFLSRLAKGAIV